MKTKTMSALLRAVLLAAGALLAVFFFLFLPFYGTDTVRAAPEFAWAYWPCLVWAWAFAVPVFWALVPAWPGLRQHCCKGYGLHWEKCP